ncbi:MAG: methyltransferase domain-containing protein [Planctomycetes bacterium]|nr:methyltransferase domain-containing protein [Planctomycetota bacterium]
MSNPPPAGSLHRHDARYESLADTPSAELARELLARVRAGEVVTTSDGDVDADVFGWLALDIERLFDVHANRLSPRHIMDVFGVYDFMATSLTPPPIEGKHVLELGCGSVNPIGRILLYVLLGAERGIAVDLDQPQSIESASRILANYIAWMLMDPYLLLGGRRDRVVTREDISRNIARANIDPGALWAGSPAIGDRLEFRRESASELSVGDGEIDICCSNSFFEHVPDVEACIAEQARVIKPGGYAIHNIDGTDHGWYESSGNQLDWLAHEPDAPMVNSCNRMRPLEYLPLFEQYGFEVLDTHTWREEQVDEAARERLVGRFRTLSLDALRHVGTVVYLRRR